MQVELHGMPVPTMDLTQKQDRHFLSPQESAMKEINSKVQLFEVTLCCFHCTNAKALFKGLEDLESHYKKRHNRFGQRCHICLNKFRSTGDLDDHLRDDHRNWKNLQYVCETCEIAKRFGSVMDLMCHNKNQHSRHREVCVYCQNVFETKVELAQHKPRHLGPPQRKLPRAKGKGKGKEKKGKGNRINH